MEYSKVDDYKFIFELLSNFRGEFIDCCYIICSWCDEREYNFEEQAHCLEVLCDNYGKIKSTETKIVKSYISRERNEQLVKSYGKFVDEVLNTTLQKAYHNGYSREEFYKRLWIALCNCGIITTIIERAFAMYYIAIDRKVPYFYLKKGLLMSNEEYQKCLLENESAIQKIRFILYSDFSQKTEEASLIIDELINAKNYEDQVILMTSILNTMRNNEKRMYKLIQQLKDEVS